MQTRALNKFRQRDPRGIAGSLCLALILTLNGDMAATVACCTMPDGTTVIESLAAAARCRSELTPEATEPAAATSNISASCSDQLLSTGSEATAAERLEGRIPVPLVVSAREILAHRPAPVTPAAVHRRSGSEGAIQLLRTVVLQT